MANSLTSFSNINILLRNEAFVFCAGLPPAIFLIRFCAKSSFRKIDSRPFFLSYIASIFQLLNIFSRVVSNGCCYRLLGRCRFVGWCIHRSYISTFINRS